MVEERKASLQLILKESGQPNTLKSSKTTSSDSITISSPSPVKSSSDFSSSSSGKKSQTALTNFVSNGLDRWSKKFEWDIELANYSKNFFGVNSFRLLQREVINATLSKQDCFVVMPTGAGKSLCYQLPGIYSDNSITLVISPLLSLIQDQVMQLQALNINAAMITSTISKRTDACNSQRYGPRKLRTSTLIRNAGKDRQEQDLRFETGEIIQRRQTSENRGGRSPLLQPVSVFY